MELEKILNSVAHGTLSVSEARKKIEEAMVAKVDGTTGLWWPIEKIKSAVSENVSPQLEKLQENLSHLQGNLQGINFSSSSPGIESRLSIFRSLEVSADSTVENNDVVGSQWFGVEFCRKAVATNNKWTASQFTESKLSETYFLDNRFSLTRLSNIEMDEARVEKNKFNRTSFIDVEVSGSDFSNNSLIKSEVAQISITNSVIQKNSLHSSEFIECDFDSCDIQNIEFVNCHFRECSFQDVKLVSEKPLQVKDINVTGKSVSHVHTLKEFLQSLNASERAGAEAMRSLLQLNRKKRRGKKPFKGIKTPVSPVENKSIKEQEGEI